MVRWTVLGVLVAVLIGALGWATFIVLDEGEGSNPIRKVDSLISPEPAPSQQREQVLAAAKTFVERFNTYGPSMLDDQDTLPDYVAVAKLMTDKFAAVFEDNACLAEQTVAQTGIDRVASVQSVGVATIDGDSAKALAGGIVQSSYPDPKKKDKRVDFAPLRFRYEVSLVRQDGRWRIDDLDDLDDNAASLGQGSDVDPAQACGAPAPQDQSGPGDQSSPGGQSSSPDEPSPSKGSGTGQEDKR